jgi:iron complex outermembrane recepter protein
MTMTASRYATSFVSLMALSLGLGSVAHAQDAAPAEQPEEVVVTMQKREQVALKVPASLTALSSSYMRDLGLNDFAQLSRFVPGFEVQDQSPNNPGFVIRGITSDSGASTGETRVSVFQDGVSISRSRGSYVELFDLSRVEIAKGPQSTLFGRGALIGAVNIVQAKADPKAFAAGVDVSAGNLDFHQVDGMINVPLAEGLALRVSGRSKHRDGYVENLLGGEDFNSLDTDAVRVALNMRPSDKFNIDFIVNHQEDGNTGTSFKSGTFVPTNPTTGAVLGTKSPYTGAALANSYGFHDDRQLGLQRKLDGLSLLATYSLSDTLSLSSISAFRKFRSSEVFDPDGFSLNLLTAAEDAEGTQTSQEFRLNYDNHDKLSWFAGVTGFHEEGSQYVPLQINERAYLAFTQHLLNPAAPATEAQINGALALNPTTAPLLPLLKPNHREDSTNFGETTSFDVYGDVTYAFTPKFEVSAGLRYTHDDKTSGFASHTSDNSGLAAIQYAQTYTTAYVTNIFTTTGVLLSPTQQNAVLQGALAGALAQPLGLTVQPTANNGDRINKDFTDEGFTWRLVGRYEFSDNVNTYLSYARGRQPKTISGSAPSTPLGAPNFTEAKSETVDSLEWGVKSKLLGGRLSWDASVYNYDYQNFQTSVQISATQFVVKSAGEANAYGFETQGYFRALPGVDVFGSYAYNHARFGNGLFEGNHFRLSPDHKASVGARLKFTNSLGTWSAVPSYSWQSETFFDDNNDLPKFQTATGDTVQDEKQGAYGLLNLRLGFAPAKSHWSVEVFGDNILDEQYIKDAGNTGDTLGAATFIAGAPATYGVTLRYKF